MLWHIHDIVRQVYARENYQHNQFAREKDFNKYKAIKDLIPLTSDCDTDALILLWKH